MRTNNLKALISLGAGQLHPFSKAVTDSKEVGVIVPSILRFKLISLGYEIRETKLKFLTQIDVIVDGVVIASGTSVDANDALLHAALGFVREHEIETLKREKGMEHRDAQMAVLNKTY